MSLKIFQIKILTKILNVKQKSRISYLTLNFLSSIYIVLLFNISIIFSLSNNSLEILCLTGVLVAAFNLIFLLFSFKYIQKTFLGFLILISSLISYFAVRYKIEFDYVMLQNVFETTGKEAFEYFSYKLLKWFLVTGVLPFTLIIFCRVNYPVTFFAGLLQKLKYAIIIIVLTLSLAYAYKQNITLKHYNKAIRNKIIPISFIYNAGRYIKYTFFLYEKKHIRIGEDAKELRGEGSKPTLLIIIVGESARSKNYSLNGYNKPTNFYTEKIENIISFKNTESCGTSTCISVPCMFSNMTKENYKTGIAKSRDNLLDILTYAGISVSWRSNNSGCRGVFKRISNYSVTNITHKKFCKDNNCYDEALLENLEKDIKNTNRSKVIVLHLIGSHGPLYAERYPSGHNVFNPVCKRADIENCTATDLINTYDNSLRYTDFVTAKLIRKLHSLKESYNTAMIYMSDHGESLGESGIYLHGMPVTIAPSEQLQIPFIIWISDELKKQNELNLSCLRKNSNALHYSHDNLFHSVLGIMNIETKEYDKNLDVFALCRKVAEPGSN